MQCISGSLERKGTFFMLVTLNQWDTNSGDKHEKDFLFLSTLFILSVLILSACSGGTSTSPTGEWTLVSYGDASNPTSALPDVKHPSTSTRMAHSAEAWDATLGADYKVDSDQITFGSIVSTMMFCEGISDQESAVLNILTDKMVSFTVNGDQLT